MYGGKFDTCQRDASGFILVHVRGADFVLPSTAKGKREQNVGADLVAGPCDVQHFKRIYWILFVLVKFPACRGYRRPEQSHEIKIIL